MVWIEIHSGDGLINDEMIERIYCKTPQRYKEVFEIHAEVNGYPWLIYSENLPQKINEAISKKAKKNPKFGKDYSETGKAFDEAFKDVYSEICDKEGKILSKLMSILFEAKKIDNNQIISFSERFSE